MNQSVCWIQTPRDTDLDQAGRAAFDRVRKPDEAVPNLYRAFAAWPAPLPVAHELYRAILHDPDGPLAMAEREMIATQVAILSACGYAETHHGANFRRFHGDPAAAETILSGLRDRHYPDPPFDGRLRAMAIYSEKLTRAPDLMTESDIAALREAGLSDAEIFQLNQIAASFGYWTRVINGLGIRLGDEAVGLDPATLEALAEQAGERD